MTDTDDNLWRYTVRDLDPAHDTWEQIGRRPMNGERGEGAAAIDTKNNLFLHGLTANSFGFWDLDHPDAATNREIQVFPDVEGSAILPDFSDFGVQYDPTLGAFVLWDGSSSVWLLTPPEDLDSNNDGILDVATGWQLKLIAVSGAGPQIPTEKYSYTGVFGKWICTWRSTRLTWESLTQFQVMCSSISRCMKRSKYVNRSLHQCLRRAPPPCFWSGYLGCLLHPSSAGA